jgi:hypothetical protein
MFDAQEEKARPEHAVPIDALFNAALDPGFAILGHGFYRGRGTGTVLRAGKLTALSPAWAKQRANQE